eukprot:7291230-Pyramimonas_sp.AAC.1
MSLTPRARVRVLLEPLRPFIRGVSGHLGDIWGIRCALLDCLGCILGRFGGRGGLPRLSPKPTW